MSLTKNRIFYNLNMSFFDFKNLFDYKLLLILGLAIILLYIYYEIEYINYKIDLLSDSIYALKNKDVQSESNTLNKCNVSTVNANASNTDTESKSDVNTSDTESKSDVNAAYTKMKKRHDDGRSIERVKRYQRENPEKDEWNEQEELQEDHGNRPKEIWEVLG